MNKMSSIQIALCPFLTLVLGKEISITPIKAVIIPIIFSAVMLSLLCQIMAIIEIAIDILTATDVEATPFLCELSPIIKNKEMNNIAHNKA